MDRKSRLARALGACILLALVLPPGIALAHDHVACGSFDCVVGWVTEPVVGGQPNGLELHISTKGESPEDIVGVEETLQFAVEYGGVRKVYALQPVIDEPGSYTAYFIPVRAGQYTFHFTGTINGEAVDFTVEPEEVVQAADFEFPGPAVSADALAPRLAAAQTIAIIGTVLGALGVGLGALSLLRKK